MLSQLPWSDGRPTISVMPWPCFTPLLSIVLHTLPVFTTKTVGSTQYVSLEIMSTNEEKKTRLKVLVPFIGRKMLCIKCLLQVNKERLMHLISNAYYIMVLTLLIIVPPHFPEFLKFLSILICIKTIQGLSMHAFKTLYPFTILLPLFDFNLFELNFTFICK